LKRSHVLLVGASDPLIIVTFLTNQMTDLRYSTGEELEQFLYEKCRQDPDLLATIINEYVCSLSDNKLIELEDFLTNNFGDN